MMQTILNQNPYELSVVSLNPGSDGKTLKKHLLDGTSVVGVQKDEPFEIRFKNNTWEQVQVRISLDGTDICTGEEASTEASGKMFVVNAMDELKLNAWPEDLEGGSRFVFSNEEGSVALHTHGNDSSLGFIAAAVFVEGHQEPTVYWPWNNWYIWNWPWAETKPYQPYRIYCQTHTSDNTGSFSSGILRNGGGGTVSSNSLNLKDCHEGSASMGETYDCSVATVGAGEYTQQPISLVKGFVKPELKTTLSLRYMWWKDLKAQLQQEKKASKTLSRGFPGDNKKMIDLSQVPKTASNRAKPQKVDVPLRFI